MTRKRDINDWLLWLMVFWIFMDKFSLLSVFLCLAMAVALYIATDFIDKKWFREDEE